MDNFNDVAAKYLANYMYWFKWIELFKTDNDSVKCNRLFIQSHTSYSDAKTKDFKIREMLYIQYICYIIHSCYILQLINAYQGEFY